jgi:hypothetical protein
MTGRFDLKPEIFALAIREIVFIRHLVSPAGVHIDPERTRGIRDFSTPRDEEH